MLEVCWKGTTYHTMIIPKCQTVHVGSVRRLEITKLLQFTRVASPGQARSRQSAQSGKWNFYAALLNSTAFQWFSLPRATMQPKRHERERMINNFNVRLRSRGLLASARSRGEGPPLQASTAFAQTRNALTMLRAATRFKLKPTGDCTILRIIRARACCTGDLRIVTREIEQDHCRYVRVEGGNLSKSFFRYWNCWYCN